MLRSALGFGRLKQVDGAGGEQRKDQQREQGLQHGQKFRPARQHWHLRA